MKLSKKEKSYLLKLSRSALEHIFKTGEQLEIEASAVPDKLKEKKATFVTLNKNKELRGCIGKLISIQELYRDVLENTYSAAFRDPRFPQLSGEEVKEINIEISVLGTPKELKFKNKEDLLDKLSKQKPGVLIEMGFHSATFLPQVWYDIEDPEEFLSHLCQKARLPKDMWKNREMKISTYTVDRFKEI